MESVSDEHAGDGPFEALSWALSPFLIELQVPARTDQTCFRGYVRMSGNRVRVMVTAGHREMGTPLAIDFDLTSKDGALNRSSVIDFARSLSASQVAGFRGAGARVDSHGNIVLRAEQLGFQNDIDHWAFDVHLFSVFTVLVWGAGRPSAEDMFSVTGALLTTDGDLRLYIRLVTTNEVVGVQLPIRKEHGRGVASSAAISGELASLARDRFHNVDRVQEEDEYCLFVVDMISWLSYSHLNNDPA